MQESESLVPQRFPAQFNKKFNNHTIFYLAKAGILTSTHPWRGSL